MFRDLRRLPTVDPNNYNRFTAKDAKDAKDGETPNDHGSSRSFTILLIPSLR